MTAEKKIPASVAKIVVLKDEIAAMRKTLDAATPAVAKIREDIGAEARKTHPTVDGISVDAETLKRLIEAPSMETVAAAAYLEDVTARVRTAAIEWTKTEIGRRSGQTGGAAKIRTDLANAIDRYNMRREIAVEDGDLAADDAAFPPMTAPKKGGTRAAGGGTRRNTATANVDRHYGWRYVLNGDVKGPGYSYSDLAFYGIGEDVDGGRTAKLASLHAPAGRTDEWSVTYTRRNGTTSTIGCIHVPAETAPETETAPKSEETATA